MRVPELELDLEMGLGKSRGYFPLFLSLRVSLAVLQPSQAMRSMDARVTTVRVMTASKDKTVNIIPIIIFVVITRIYTMD